MSATIAAGGPYSAVVVGAVVLDGSGSSDPGSQDVLSYQWDFDYDNVTFDGDGVGATPGTTYTSAGGFTVALRVSDQHGGTSSIATATVTIADSLVAEAGHGGGADEQSPVSFTGSATGGVPPYTYQWVFPPDSSVSNEQNPTHIFPDDGEFNVSLRVTDSTGAFDDALVPVSVTNVAADAVANGPYVSFTDVDIPFDATGSSDVSPLDVLGFEWASDYDGSFAFACEGQTDPGCRLGVPGVYTAAVRVSDSDASEYSQELSAP